MTRCQGPRGAQQRQSQTSKRPNCTRQWRHPRRMVPVVHATLTRENSTVKDKKQQQGDLNPVHGVAQRERESQVVQGAAPRPGSVRVVGGTGNLFPQGRHNTTPETFLPTSSIDQDTYTPVGTAEFASALYQHPVMQLLLERQRQGSQPGTRASGDVAKIGLVVEGGGMRGIVSGAMLMALDALGLRNCFDAVYGASAGAINLTYFLSGQRHGLDIYTHDLSGTRFIDFRALLTGGGRPVMDLDYLVDHVMHDVRPLDWHKVMNSPVPLKVVASSLDSLSPVLLEGWSSKSDLVECLKASATVPQIAGPPRRCRGHNLVDAAIFEPVPLRTALRDGCTHVLVLCTRPATLHTTWRRAVRGTVVRVVKQTVLNAPYMKAAWNSESSEQLASQDEELVDTLAAPPDHTLSKLGAYVMPVYPDSVGGCNPVTTDPKKLRLAEAEGWRSIASLFSAQELLLQYGGKGGVQQAAGLVRQGRNRRKSKAHIAQPVQPVPGRPLNWLQYGGKGGAQQAAGLVRQGARQA